jgi:hypothetical protein
MRLTNAEYALAALSSGRPLGRSLAIVAEIELRPLAELPGAAGILLDAYRGIQSVAAGGTYQLDPAGRRDAAWLADEVRRLQHALREAALSGDHDDVFLGLGSG